MLQLTRNQTTRVALTLKEKNKPEPFEVFITREQNKDSYPLGLTVILNNNRSTVLDVFVDDFIPSGDYIYEVYSGGDLIEKGKARIISEENDTEFNAFTTNEKIFE
jgi:hypothetical protein